MSLTRDCYLFTALLLGKNIFVVIFFFNVGEPYNKSSRFWELLDESYYRIKWSLYKFQKLF